MLTTEGLVSIHYQTFDPLYPFHPPATPPHPPPLVTTTLLSVSTCLPCFVLFIIYLSIYLIFHTGAKSYSICLFPSDLFHLA